MSMPAEKVAELKAFITAVEKTPSILHLPELAFFKTFMEQHGAKLPPTSGGAPSSTPDTKTNSAVYSENSSESSESESGEEVPLPEYPVFDADEGHMDAESEEFPSLANTTECEFKDEDHDKHGKLKEEASDAMQNGDHKTALAKYTEVMGMGNSSALLCTRRAEVLLKLRRPKAAIKDCDEALSLNPDNGKAYKIRGRAQRALGNWKQSHRDLDLGQKIDYDEESYEVQKFVAERALKIEEYERTIARIEEEKTKKRKIKEMKARKKKAQREYERQKEDADDFSGFPGGFPGGMGGMPGGMGGMPGGMGGMPGGMGGMPGGMGGMPEGAGGMPGGLGSMLSGLMSDPEMKKVFENPKMMQAMQDIMSNPANLSKYKNDPEVMAAFQKMTSKFGGGVGQA